jgi:hypothetical protein
MVRNKVTYYKLLIPEHRAEEEAHTAHRAARIAAGLHSDSPEEEEAQEQEGEEAEQQEGQVGWR